jgi:hypothetical protein
MMTMMQLTRAKGHRTHADALQAALSAHDVLAGAPEATVRRGNSFLAPNILTFQLDTTQLPAVGVEILACTHTGAHTHTHTLSLSFSLFLSLSLSLSISLSLFLSICVCGCYALSLSAQGITLRAEGPQRRPTIARIAAASAATTTGDVCADV